MLEQALASGAEPYEAHQTLAELRFDHGNKEAALASLDRALESAVGGGIARTQTLRGTILAQLGRDAECKAAWLAAEKAGNADAGKRRRDRFGHETAGDFFDEALQWLNAGRWDQGWSRCCGPRSSRARTSSPPATSGARARRATSRSSRSAILSRRRPRSPRGASG